ncbi:cGMP-dependent protein kinase [Biomphalaria glabrata]
MGSLQEMERLLRSKDEKIKDMQRLLDEKEERIMQLRSKLDKFQSILPQTQNNMIMGPRKQRAQGISAEPQAMRNLDICKSTQKRYVKSESEYISSLAWVLNGNPLSSLSIVLVNNQCPNSTTQRHVKSSNYTLSQPCSPSR